MYREREGGGEGEGGEAFSEMGKVSLLSVLDTGQRTREDCGDLRQGHRGRERGWNRKRGGVRELEREGRISYSLQQ